MLAIFAIYGLIGAIVGVLAGMLGIGGGIVIVPILLMTFNYEGISPEIAMYLAIGTSLASIIFTGISSAFSHHRYANIVWSIVKMVTPGILIGSYVGSFFASEIPTKYLQILFSLFLFFVSIQMLSGKQPKASAHMPGFFGMILAGIVVGIVASLVGIGGGVLSVPFMLYHNIDMRKAIGTSAAIGIPIALSGSFGYFINGLGVADLPQYAAGYIYLPALGGIVLLSIFTAPLGVRLAQVLPIAQVRKYFALFVIIVGIRMFLKAI